jgi:hypothetical protein
MEQPDGEKGGLIRREAGEQPMFKVPAPKTSLLGKHAAARCCCCTHCYCFVARFFMFEACLESNGWPERAAGSR